MSHDPTAGWAEVPADTSTWAEAPAEGTHLTQDAAPTAGWAEQPVEDVDAQSEAFLKRSFSQAFQVNTERRASVLKLAEESGAGADFIDRNYERMRASWETAKFDPAAWRRENPALAKTVLEHAQVAPIIMRDEKVSALTKALRWTSAQLTLGTQAIYGRQKIKPLFGSPLDVGNQAQAPSPADVAEAEKVLSGEPRQIPTVDDARALQAQGLTGFARARIPVMVFEDALKQAEMSRVAFSVMTGKLRGIDTWDEEKHLADLRAQSVPRDYGDAGFLEGIARDAASIGASEVSSIVAGGGAGAAAGAVTLAATRKPALAGEVAALAGKAGATTASFVHEAGGAYLDYRDAKDENDQPLDERYVIGGALLYGAAAAAVETASFGAAGRSLGPVGEAVLSGKGREYVRNLLLTKSGRELATRALKGWVDRAGTEGLEEFVQQVMQDKVQKQIGDASITSAGTAERAVGALSQAAVGTLVLGGGEAVGVRAITKALNVAGSLRSQAQTKAIQDAADSTTARASPAALAQIIEHESAAAGEAVTHIYVDPAKAAEVGAPVSPDAVKDALATGGKIEVPVAEYVENWAPKYGEQLADHIATRPGYMSAAESKGAEAEVEAQAQAIASEPVSDIPAIDVAVAQQVEEQGAKPLPQDVLGVPAEEYQAYLDAQVKAKSTAALRAELAAKKDELRTKETWWKEQEATLREQAAAEFEVQPARKASLWLRGKVAEEDGTITPVAVTKLDYEATKAIVGNDVKRLPTTKKGGIHPDDMAAQVQFNSGKEMLDAVLAVPEKDAWVKRTASERMAERHPAVLEDTSRLRRIVDQGLHGEESNRWLFKEIVALSKKSGEGAVRAEAIKRAAEIVVERHTIGTLNAHLALQRERSAANKKTLSAIRGEWGRAYAYAQQQLLNMHLWREVDAARDERDSFLDLASSLTTRPARERLGKASPIYRDGVDTVLEALGLKRPEPREAPPASTGEVVTQMDGDGATVGFDPQAIGKLLAQPRPWKNLTLAEMREVRTYLENLRGAARGRLEVIVGDRRVALEDQAAALEDMAFANRKDRGPVSASVDTDSDIEVGTAYGQAFDALNLRVETMVSWLDAHDIDGPWFRSLIQPMQEGKVEENDIIEKSVRPIVDAFEAIPKKERRKAMNRVDGDALFPNHISGEIEAPNRMLHLWMLWLYRGNQGGLDRLETGRGITKAELDASIAKYGSPAIMSWLQSIWDAAEALKKPAFDAEEADSGVRPKEVPAVAVETPWGAFRGGYWPNVYDRRPGQPSARQVALSQGDLFDRSFTRVGTSHAYLKSRVDSYNGALSLATSNIYSHLAQVAHDIAFRQRVKSVGALLMQPNVDRALRRTLGEERSKQFLAWAKRIGTMRGGDTAQHLGKMNRFLGAMRGNVAIAMLGYRPSIGIGDLANLPVALTHAGVSPTYLASAVAELSRDYVSSAGGLRDKIALKDWAFQNIGELRVMENQWRREYTKMVRGLTKRRVPGIAEVRDHAFVMMEMSFTATAVPTAVATYRQAEAEGLSPKEAELRAGKMLREVFPSHSPVDQAALLADRGFWGYSSLFMGYLNTMYQRERDILEPVLQSAGPAQFAGRLAYASGSMAALVISYGIFAEFLMGRGKEDDETWAGWMLRKGITQTLAPVPFVNEAAGMVEQYALGRQPSPRTANPFLMYGEAWAKAAIAVGDSSVPADRTFNALARAGGLTFGIPQTPFTVMGPYLYDLAEGQAGAQNPFDVASGLAYGNRPGLPANPFSVMSDFVSGR